MSPYLNACPCLSRFIVCAYVRCVCASGYHVTSHAKYLCRPPVKQGLTGPLETTWHFEKHNLGCTRTHIQTNKQTWIHKHVQTCRQRRNPQTYTAGEYTKYFFWKHASLLFRNNTYIYTQHVKKKIKIQNKIGLRNNSNSRLIIQTSHQLIFAVYQTHTHTVPCINIL